jgi:tetratricopeptide (TPR) repeat protein
MALKYSFRLSLLFCMFAGLGPSLFAQATGTVKEAQPSGPTYSSEEAQALTTKLAQRDAELRTQLSLQPESADLLFALALVLREENKPRESIDMYTRAAKSRNPTPRELRSVALDYVLLEDYEDAIHWLEVAARMDPVDTTVLYSLARCYYSKDRYLDAEHAYERILTIQPMHVKAEENLGLVYDATNRPEKAEEALRKAVSWSSETGTDEWPFFDLGSFLLDQDRAKEAADPLRVTVKIRPACAACHEKLGRALLAIHNTAGGLAELEQATQLDPNNAKIHFEFGRALRQAGQVERAQKELSLSQKLYTSHSQE